MYANLSLFASKVRINTVRTDTLLRDIGKNVAKKVIQFCRAEHLFDNFEFALACVTLFRIVDIYLAAAGFYGAYCIYQL